MKIWKRSVVLIALFAGNTAAASGFFSVTQTASGHWQLLDPAGAPFFSRGVCVVIPKDTALKAGADGYDPQKKEGLSYEAWSKRALSVLKGAGFDSLGSWSHDGLYPSLPYAHSLSLAGYGDMGKRLVDVFSPEYAARVQSAAKAGVTARLQDKNLIGYFLDNELPWYGDTGWPGAQNTPLLDKYLALPPGAPGWIQAHAYFKRHLAAAEEPTNAERTGFLGKVAEEYFKVTTEAVRAADPKHLILGARFAGPTPRPVIVACGHYCDVISVNSYSKSGDFDFELFDTVYALTKRPVMLTEFSYRAMENRSGDQNRQGADVTVATQAERAVKLKKFLGSALELKYLVGYHWFQYFDESPQGRSFDGEDSDYGLVDINDKPYSGLLAAFKDLNANAMKRHLAATRALPEKAPEPQAIRVRQAVGAETVLKEARPWGDKASEWGVSVPWNEASAKISQAVKEGALVLSYDSGQGWGLGVALKPQGSLLKDGSANVLGATRLEVKLVAAKGQKFQLVISESGVGDPASANFNGVGGADGESWGSATYTGTGQPQTLSFDIAEAEARPYWGNQHGNKTIDLQAIKNLDITIAGAQGKGEMKVIRVRFLP